MGSINNIIDSYVTEVYPEGVGSVNRFIKSEDLSRLEWGIKERVLNVIMSDLYSELQELGYSKEEIKVWVNKVM